MEGEETQNKISENNEMSRAAKKRDYLLPASIMLAAVLVSVSFIYSAGKREEKAGSGNLAANLEENAEKKTAAPSFTEAKQVTEEDHVRGNRDAPVTLIEFSDFECPYCKIFHDTMREVMRDYDGKVRWVYRDFPIDSLHPKARREAEAAECAAALGGTSAFWSYADRIFEITPSNNGLNLDLLPEIAAQIGLDRSQFTLCLESGKYRENVARDLAQGAGAGARGTPYSLVVSQTGRVLVIPGAISYEELRPILDQALREGK